MEEFQIHFYLKCKKNGCQELQHFQFSRSAFEPLTGILENPQPYFYVCLRCKQKTVLT